MSDARREKSLVMTALCYSGWLHIHTAFLKHISLESAVLLQFLIDRYADLRTSRRYKDSGLDGWFECTIDSLKNSLGLSRKVQDRVLDELKDKNLIECTRMGMPSKRCIRVNLDALAEMLIEEDNRHCF